MRIGIENLALYPCSLALDMRSLALARGADVEEICGAMMIGERAVNPPWEDPVTMAVNAALPLLDDSVRERVRLLLVGSESSLDQEKALSTWAQRHLGLRDDCRNLELKHACYAGTGALQLACAFLLAQDDEDAAALVITTDQSRMHLGKPYEFVFGAGAVALLVSRRPRFLALDWGLSGVFTDEVPDLLRPTSTVEAGHSEISLLSYLDAVDITFERYRAALRRAGRGRIDNPDELRQCLPRQVYHAPFGGITRRAHKALLRSLDDYDRNAVDADFAARVEPGLAINRRVGGIYAGSIFASLLASAIDLGADAEGTRCGIYSYGSGSCAEYYSGVFGSGAAAAQPDIHARLDARKQLSVPQYEQVEGARAAQIDQADFDVPTGGLDNWYAGHYAGRGQLVLRGAREYVREYEWS